MAQNLRAQNRLVQTELTIELSDGGGSGVDVDHRVDTFSMLQDLVGETTLTLDIDLVDRAAVLAHNIEERIQ